MISLSPAEEKVLRRLQGLGYIDEGEEAVAQKLVENGMAAKKDASLHGGCPCGRHYVLTHEAQKLLDRLDMEGEHDTTRDS